MKFFQASAGVKDEVLESYCWMYAHFQIPKEYIGPCSGKDQESIEGPIYNSYYQWIPIYLMFLAILFYLPRMLWMVMEGNIFMKISLYSHFLPQLFVYVFRWSDEIFW